MSSSGSLVDVSDDGGRFDNGGCRLLPREVSLIGGEVSSPSSSPSPDSSSESFEAAMDYDRRAAEDVTSGTIPDEGKDATEGGGAQDVHVSGVAAEVASLRERRREVEARRARKGAEGLAVAKSVVAAARDAHEAVPSEVFVAPHRRGGNRPLAELPLVAAEGYAWVKGDVVCPRSKIYS